MNQEDKNIIDKYLNNNASIEEQSKFKKLLSQSHVYGLKEYIRKDWDDYFKANQDSEINDLSNVLDRLHHKINLKESLQRQSFTRKLFQWYSKAVAIIIIPLMIAGMVALIKFVNLNQLLAEKSSVVSISSPSGMRMSFNLPDGTMGTLNGNSTIEYPVPFTNNRKVKLSGEAYFEVYHDKKHPFVVNTNLIDIQVLGTKFNVDAYPDVNYATVILEEGSVLCELSSVKKKIILNPNQRIRVVGETYDKRDVNAQEYTAWRNGKMILHGDSMEDVAHRISRWYGVDVDIQDAELSAYSFRATFVNDSLEEVLRLLKMTSPIDYKIIERQKLSDGSFSKKQVILYKKELQ